MLSKYFRAEGHKEGSVLIQNRFATSAKNGVAIEDIARYEVGGSISILVNTTPAVFWLVYFLYSEPELLEEIRKEVGAVVGTSTDENGQAVRSLGITNVKTSCPLLLSTSQESLHNRAMGTSVREVMDDTVIDGKWLLKKAAMIQMPSRTIHMDHQWTHASGAPTSNPSTLDASSQTKMQNVSTQLPSVALAAAPRYVPGDTLRPTRSWPCYRCLSCDLI